MKAIIINNFRRLWQQKLLLVLLVVLTASASAAAIFVSTNMTQTWDVAVVSDTPANITSDQVRISLMKTAPLRSELVSGRYDAVLTIQADGSRTLETIKSPETAARLADALAGKPGSPAMFSGRGTGTNVLGFLMMFILMMGSTCMTFYADDKTGGQITRVAASPVKISTYLLAHCLFDFGFLFIPTTAILSVVKWMSKVSIGYNFLQLAGLIALLCSCSTVLSLLLYSLLPNKDDAAKMSGNTLIILTSILAGGFFAFDRGNRALELVIQVLPQKAFLNIAAGMEQQAAWPDLLPSLIYLLVLIVACYAVSVIKTERTYVNH